ncbi:hypothetical protein IWW48_000818, partial [Coemansia sp. RSA 1200]
MTFAAIVKCILNANCTVEYVWAGRTLDGNASSTTGKLMVLALVAALIPTEKTASILYDSRAAIGIARILADKDDVRDSITKSNQGYLGCITRQWFQERKKPLSIQWVKAHTGNVQNEKADRAAKEAH